MDGTLVNLEELNYRSYKQAVESYFDVELDDDEYQKYFSGKQTNAGIQSFVEAEGVKDYDIEEIKKVYRDKKRNALQNRTGEVVKLIPGASEYVRFLCNQAVKISVGTSTIREFAELILKYFELWDLFDFVLAAEDVERGKPDPQVFELSLEKHNSTKEESVIFEDSKSGLESALATRVLTVGIKTPGLNDDYVGMADYVIEDYKELMT